MGAESGTWAAFGQWLIANPEKMALFLVVITGAWRWIKEIIHAAKDDAQQETFSEILMRENRELRAELREERRKRSNGNGNANDRGDDRESPR